MTNIIKVQEVETLEEYQLLKSNIEAAVKESKAVLIFNESDIEKAGFYIKKFKQLDKSLEDYRKSLVGPLNEEVKGINNLFKKIAGDYSLEIDRLNKESNEVLKEVRKRQEAIRLAEQKELEETVLEEAIMFDDDTVLNNIPQVEYKQQKLATDNLTTMRSKEWRVSDLNIVPREFLTLDETKLNAIRKGYDFEARSPIPGIEFFFDEKVRVK